MKHLQTYNESIRDKMLPKTEEELQAIRNKRLEGYEWRKENIKKIVDDLAKEYGAETEVYESGKDDVLRPDAKFTVSFDYKGVEYWLSVKPFEHETEAGYSVDRTGNWDDFEYIDDGRYQLQEWIESHEYKRKHNIKIIEMKKFDEFEQLNEEAKLSKVVKKEIVDGFTVYIGRNAEMNDILTTELTDPNDIWMHASGVPGSHVIIKVGDERPSKGTIREVAKIAAQNSKGKGKIEVVYTDGKNVTKNSKHNVGQVSVNYDKSNFIKVYSN